MNAVDLFVKLSTEPSVMISLFCGAVASMVLALVAKRACGSAFLPTLMTLASLFAAVTAMFVSGGRVLEFASIDPGLISACIMGSPFSINAQSALNTILFLPFAFSLTFTLRRTLRAFLLCFSVILSLEILQTITNHGVCEFSDVFHNIIGAAAGITIAYVIMLRSRVRRRMADR
ncbi:VanZ family protein [Actinoplanes xinjiangensis]|uniref:VanZ family protein n=1 Tax=Actinoplanes xinjiangensis TaxID=512350 RepID=UPI003439018F